MVGRSSQGPRVRSSATREGLIVAIGDTRVQGLFNDVDWTVLHLD